MNSHFYVFDGGHFVSSELTRGPWDADAQHAGPPAALLARALERCPSTADPEAPWQIGRVTLPAGEWVCLEAVTIPEPTGVWLADTAVHDERGPLGRALQTLLVRER